MDFSLGSKQKIIVLCLVFMSTAAFLFLYGYSIFDKRNHSVALKVAEGEQEYQDLLYEQVGFEQGRRDINAVRESKYAPDKLFPKNTTLVSNIKILEDLARRYNLDFTIQLSGTGAGNLRTPNVISEVYSAPYSLTLNGQFRDIMAYLQSIENLQFPTHVKNIQINAQNDGVVNVLVNAEFFIQL